MKAQCALKILNRMLPQFPSFLPVANYLRKHLQTLVDSKVDVKKEQKLYTLALGCKNNLEKKMQTMEKPPQAEHMAQGP